MISGDILNSIQEERCTDNEMILFINYTITKRASVIAALVMWAVKEFFEVVNISVLGKYILSKDRSLLIKLQIFCGDQILTYSLESTFKCFFDCFLGTYTFLKIIVR